ncbi:UDP-N-acetyl-D-mannosamine dehydrogenase [Brevundimonas sp.]|uniref:UDP-N-acetyl-D-mannosamine dehydrogenase n=1 Tax=Brevundimonas sp. TaxID=1871086 RepID=UPI0035B1B2C1
MAHFSEQRFRTVSVFGLGYVGLPTAAVFAAAGVRVIGVDINADAVASINAGRPHIVEPNLEELLERVVAAGSLRATTKPEPADVYVIAVPTPFRDGKKPDLSYVMSATDMIAPLLKSGDLVILESTSPVGATEQVAARLSEHRSDLIFPNQSADGCDVNVAHCPERILPGRVLHEVVHNDRVVGGLTPSCSEAACAFYKIAVKGDCHVTNARTAELCKLSENAFRDVNIAFANELSLICDRLGVDVWELISLTNKHPRVNVLRPGAGVGGHCIAVDPWFIVDSAPEEASLIHAARLVNDGKPAWVAAQVGDIVQTLGGVPTIACMGLAYKPDVDDLRESPSIEVVLRLVQGGSGRVLVCEPFIDTLPPVLANTGVELVSVDTALGADVIVFLTPHAQFQAIPAQALAGKQVLDPCGIGR